MMRQRSDTGVTARVDVSRVTHMLRHAAWIFTMLGLAMIPSRLARHGLATAAVAASEQRMEAPAMMLEPEGVSALALFAEGRAADADARVVGITGGVEQCARLPELFRPGNRAFDHARGAHDVHRDPDIAGLLSRIRQAACRFGVDPAIGTGVAWTESRFDQDARSPDGLSVGAFQLTETTAAEMRARLAATNVDLPLHDEVTLGVGYLRYLSRIFAQETVLADSGLTTTPIRNPVERWRFAIAAYNAGEGRVAAAQRRAGELGKNPERFDDVRPFLPPITRRYVDTVITFGASQRPLDDSEAT
jgi:hypothetical protein